MTLKYSFHITFILITSLLILPVDSKNPKIKERFKQESYTAKEITLYSVLLGKPIILNKFKEQTIHVSCESIYDNDYLHYLKNRENALVISHYPGIKRRDHTLYLTELGQAVDTRLRKLSAVQHNKFLHLLKSAPSDSPGKVLHLQLNLSKKALDVFPLKHIFILLFKEGEDEYEKEETISKGIQGIFKKTKAVKVDNLIIPCLTINWRYYNFEFDIFFDTVFEEILPESSKPNIYLSLYSDWPNFFIKEAVDSLNGTWQGIIKYYGEKEDG